MTLVMSVTRIEDLAKCKKDLIKILILQFHASGHQKMKMSIQLKASNLKLTLCLLDQYQSQVVCSIVRLMSGVFNLNPEDRLSTYGFAHAKIQKVDFRAVHSRVHRRYRYHFEWFLNLILLNK